MPERPTVWYGFFGVWVVIATAALVAIRGWGVGAVASGLSFVPLFMLYRHHRLSRRRIVFDKAKGRLFIGDVVTAPDTFRSATQAVEQIPIADMRALEVLHGGDEVDSWSELNIVRRDERRVHLFASVDGNTVKCAAVEIGEAFNLPVTSERAE